MTTIIRLDKTVMTACNLPPKIESAPRPCDCIEQHEDCTPVTRAEDAIVIRRTEVERAIKLTVDCGQELIPCEKIKLSFRRRGECKVVCEITPWRADCDNFIYFDWDDANPSLSCLEPGQYEADVYFGCEVVHTLLFVIDQMWVGVQHDRPRHGQVCGTQCAPKPRQHFHNVGCGEVPLVPPTTESLQEATTSCETCGDC